MPLRGEGSMEIEPCVWDEGELYEDYGFFYRCTGCGSTVMEPLEEEGIVNGDIAIQPGGVVNVRLLVPRGELSLLTEPYSMEEAFCF